LKRTLRKGDFHVGNYQHAGAVGGGGGMSVVGRPAAAGQPAGDNDARAKRFIEAYEAGIRPLEIEVAARGGTPTSPARTRTIARRSGGDEAGALPGRSEGVCRAQGDPSCRVSDRLLARQIEVLYLQYLGRQVDPELLKRILAKANAVEQAFNVFRPKSTARSYPTARCVACFGSRPIRPGARRCGRRARRWGRRRGRSEGARQAAQRGRPAARLPRLPRDAVVAGEQTSSSAQALRRARPPDPQSPSTRPRRRSTPLWPGSRPFRPSSPAVALPRSVLPDRPTCSAET